jgi:hypothetical protein
VVEHPIDADRILDTLDRLVVERGVPAFVRFDNGPEFITYAIADGCRFNDVSSVFIDPCSPPLTGQSDCCSSEQFASIA